MNNIHHCLPISLCWENIPENKIIMDVEVHKELHDTQDIPYRYIRQYKERTNHILIPNPYSLQQKWELWQRYFSRASVCTEEQKRSLSNQIKHYYEMTREPFDWCDDFDWLISELIRQQSVYVYQVLKYNKTIWK